MTHACSCRCDSPIEPCNALASVRPEETIADVVRHRAGALEILKEVGINHCCGAHLTLREAAAATGVPLDALLAALNERRRAPA
jgi:iron-sulfur cluster repair protein YtfE (RIC family)